MTILGVLTIYRIRRNHCNGAGFFFVRVPEVRQYGVGFQCRIRKALYGITIHTPAIRPRERLRSLIDYYGDSIMALLDGIKAEVTRDADLTAQILAKLDTLKQNAVDPAEVDALTAALKTSNDSKEAAVSA